VDFPRTRALLDAATAEGATPAATIEVGRASGMLWTHAAGTLTYDADSPAAHVDTIFDLASLTKPIATGSLVMQHARDGRLDLDAPVATILPAWSDIAHGQITVRHLLDHSSGLPAHARFWEHARGKLAFADAIHAQALERPPGISSVYSDLGFITLGFIIERVGGAPLEVQFSALRLGGDGELGFLPAPALIDRIAPTEFDSWRGRLLRGEVHDENAAALGGVAGHAGLFGTATAVGSFARLVLRTFREETALGTPELMRLFAAESAVPGSSRALAWDRMRPSSSCGTRLSASAIGHTGFTGTSLWIDPDKDRYVVLLSNRVHPTRENQKFVAVRPRIHDAVDEDVECGT
jgi:CubicO group peptidase (beta-lactamase class C family)